MREQLTIPDGWKGCCYQPGPNAMQWPHHHEELELNLVVQGKAAYLLADRRYELRRHALVWLFPKQEHLLLDCSPDFRAWVFVFKPELLQRVCSTRSKRPLLEADPIGHFCKFLPVDMANRLNALLEEVTRFQEDTDLYNAGLGYALLLAWTLDRQTEEVAASFRVHPAVELATRLLRVGEDPLDETIKIEALAARVGLSASHLSRLFKRQIGMSLTDFRNRQRLEQFLRLCDRRQDMSLLQTALEAGFGSYSQFHALFTRTMGCGPTEFLRQTRSSRTRSL